MKPHYSLMTVAMPLLLSLSVKAEEIRYELFDRANPAKMMKFFIPYKTGINDGVHEGYSEVIHGGVVTDETDNVVNAQFHVPIDDMRTGHDLRDCHLREALGLDYSRSKYPREHICSTFGAKMPKEIANSLPYPEISVEFLEMSLPAEPFNLGVPQKRQVQVKINIHGVEKIQTWPVLITKTVYPNGTQGFNVTAQFSESLKDFGVEVKSFEMLGMRLSVDDTVKIQIALPLIRK